MALITLMYAACVVPAVAEASEAIYYVSPAGNDDWSGQLAEPNDAGTDGPFATILRARDAVRKLRNTGGDLSGRVIVKIRGGRYYIDEPITFTPEDSGSSEHPVIYTSYRSETPQLIGGRPITDLRADDDKMLSATLPRVREGDWYFRQLFIDGKRQVRARYPNFDPRHPYRGGFNYVARSANGFGVTVGNIHNRGDWMEYEIEVPADGKYQFWMYYGAENEPLGRTDMAGRTALIIDDREPVPLMNLPDTGGWGDFRWSHAATIRLSAGEHRMRWKNVKGGGLDLEAYVFCDDPQWKPKGTDLPEVAAGCHQILIQAEDFVGSEGEQLSIFAGGGSKTRFRYKAGDVKPAWADAPAPWVHIYQSGSCRAFKEIVRLQKVDAESRTVTVGGRECVTELRTGDRYYVDNLFSELDSPGEWYLDRSTGKLSVIPPDGFSEDSEVIAPAVGRILQFNSGTDEDSAVTNIVISGLTIRCTDYSRNDGCIGYRMGDDGVIYMDGAKECTIENCRFNNIGKYAVCVTGGGHNRIARNHISESAEGGILLLSSFDNIVSDNHIHDCGAVYKHIGGVVLQGAGTDDNTVSHNRIHEMSRYGVTLKNAGSRNAIEYNAIQRTNLETYDTGGIEVTQHDKEFRSHSVIQNNIVADTVGYSSKGGKPVYLSWGIYLDSYASGYTVRNNITYRNSHGGVMLQGGRDNTVMNNIFADSKYRQIHIANFRDHSRGQVLKKNIVYAVNPDSVLIATGAIHDGVIDIDRNIYFCANESEAEVNKGGHQIPFEQWQKLGYDENSIIADPLFVDASNDNYHVKPDSPAFELGFEAIDTSGVGPRRAE